MKTSGAKYVKIGSTSCLKTPWSRSTLLESKLHLFKGLCSIAQLQQLLLNKWIFSCRIIVFYDCEMTQAGQISAGGGVAWALWSALCSLQCSSAKCAQLLLHYNEDVTCCEASAAWGRGVGNMAYRRKFREQPGELTPRNLDHSVSAGLVDSEGRRALIYGNSCEGSPHPLFLSSIPQEGKETASSEQWPVESVDGAPRL